MLLALVPFALLLALPAAAVLPLDDQTLFYQEDFVGETAHPLTAEVGSATTSDASSTGGSVAFTGVADMSAQATLGPDGFETGAFAFFLDQALPPVLEFDVVASFDDFAPTIVGEGLVNTAVSGFSFFEPMPDVFVPAFSASAALQSGTIFGTPSDPDELVLTIIEQNAGGGILGFINVTLDAARSAALLGGAAYRLQLRFEFLGNTVIAGLEVDGFLPLLTTPLALTELGELVGDPSDRLITFTAAVNAFNRFPNGLGADDSGTVDLERIELRGDRLFDFDDDGFFDRFDNCVEIANPGQEDANAGEDDDASLPGSQSYGDACDADLDEDGIVGPSDFFAVFRPCLGSDIVTDPACAEADLDGDGSVGPSDFFSGLRPRLGTAPGPGITQ